MKIYDSKFLQKLLTTPNQAHLHKLLDEYELNKENLLYLALCSAVGAYFDILHESDYTGSLQNGIGNYGISSWMKNHLSTEEYQEFDNTNDLLGNFLFSNSYIDWWDIDAYRWDEPGKLEEQVWFNEDDLRGVLLLLPQVLPLIITNDLMFTMLQLSLTSFVEEGVLDIPGKPQAENVPEVVEALQLEVLYILAEVLMLRENTRLTGIELFMTYHLRATNGKPELVKQHWAELRKYGLSPLVNEVVAFYIFKEGKPEIALDIWTEAEGNYQANKDKGVQWTWIDAEQVLFRQLTEKVADHLPYLLQFAQIFAERHPTLFYFKTFWATHQPDALKRELLLNIFDDLPKDMYFTAYYTLERTQDTIKGYRNELLGYHIEATIALKPDAVRCRQLLKLLDVYKEIGGYLNKNLRKWEKKNRK